MFNKKYPVALKIIINAAVNANYSLMLITHDEGVERNCTFPSGRTEALDNPECLLQLVAMGQQIKDTSSMPGTVTHIYVYVGSRNSAFSVGGRKPGHCM